MQPRKNSAVDDIAHVFATIIELVEIAHIQDIMRVAIATGAREEELYLAAPSQVDHNRRQMTLIGKGRKGVKKHQSHRP